MFTCLLFYFHSFTSVQTEKLSHFNTISDSVSRVWLNRCAPHDTFDVFRVQNVAFVSLSLSLRTILTHTHKSYGWLSNIHVLMSFKLSDRWKHVVYTRPIIVFSAMCFSSVLCMAALVKPIWAIRQPCTIIDSLHRESSLFDFLFALILVRPLDVVVGSLWFSW